MSTTELFVEHVISGVLSIIWIGSLLFSITGNQYVSIEFVNQNWVVIAFILLPISYPIGIIVDAIGDALLRKQEKKMKDLIYKGNEISIVKVLQTIQFDNTTNYFTYNRFKARVARSSIVNFFMIGICFLLVITKKIEDFSWSLPITVFILFMVLAVSGYILWKDTMKTILMKVYLLWSELNDIMKV